METVKCHNTGELLTTPLHLIIDQVEYECFGDEHSLSDIVRWLMGNVVDAEQVRDMLDEALTERNAALAA